jgi:hypothetical protein
MDPSLPPSSHGVDEQEAKDDDDFENVEVWWFSLTFLICKLYVALYVNLNYNICVCLLKYVTKFTARKYDAKVNLSISFNARRAVTMVHW